MPTSLPIWSILVVTNSVSRNSGVARTRPRPASLAALRGQVSTSLPPCATSARSTFASGSVPFCAICSTTLLEPSPMTGNISPVLGIGRCGIPCCARASSAGVPAKAATPAAATERATNSRRVVVECGVIVVRLSVKSMCHCVHDEVRAHAERVSRGRQRIIWAAVPLPEVREVVVVQGHDRDVPDRVHETVVDRRWAGRVRRHALEVLDYVHEIEDRVVDGEPLEHPIREDAEHL